MKHKAMTELEKKIVTALKQTGNIWDAIAIAQKYENQRLYDRVLDNILKWGVEGILEKPDRIFYGDNTTIHELNEEIVAGAEKPSEWDGSDVGRRYDEIVRVAAQMGLRCFDEFIRQREEREPKVTITQVHVPNPKALKKDNIKTETFKKAMELLNIAIQGDEIFEYQGDLIATNLHTISVYKMR